MVAAPTADTKNKTQLPEMRQSRHRAKIASKLPQTVSYLDLCCDPGTFLSFLIFKHEHTGLFWVTLTNEMLGIVHCHFSSSSFVSSSFYPPRLLLFQSCDQVGWSHFLQ